MIEFRGQPGSNRNLKSSDPYCWEEGEEGEGVTLDFGVAAAPVPLSGAFDGAAGFAAVLASASGVVG